MEDKYPLQSIFMRSWTCVRFIEIGYILKPFTNNRSVFWFYHLITALLTVGVIYYRFNFGGNFDLLLPNLYPEMIAGKEGGCLR